MSGLLGSLNEEQEMSHAYALGTFCSTALRITRLSGVREPPRRQTKHKTVPPHTLLNNVSFALSVTATDQMDTADLLLRLRDMIMPPTSPYLDCHSDVQEQWQIKSAMGHVSVL